MQEKRQTSTVWIIVLVLIGLLGACVLGSLLGGAIGYALGRREAQVTRFAPMPHDQPMRPWRYQPQPEPPAPGLPELPVPEVITVSGALIVEVVPESPAERAGLQVGDIIVQVDDVRLAADVELADVIARYEPGERIVLLVIRPSVDVRERQVRVTLDRHPEKPGETARLGVTYRTIRAPLPFRFERPGLEMERW